MAIEWAGLFAETSGIEGAPSIRDVVGVVPSEARAAVAGYLDGGVVIGAVPGLVPDVLGGPGSVLPLDLMSDGVYVWRRFLSHYVRRYGVGVPADLIQRATAQVEFMQFEPKVEQAITAWLRDQMDAGSL